MEFSSRTYRELGISRISGRRKEGVEMYVRAKALAATLASPLTRKSDSQKIFLLYLAVEVRRLTVRYLVENRSSSLVTGERMVYAKKEQGLSESLEIEVAEEETQAE
ncbi:hypothetical protein HZH68_015526 [Vespula germanica]|uniref:Uncharacterized protein n=1 Tax=Vespula germanica TaxID=30212 RepID=A0A834MRF5_VESGE|nr:hypothetical protein HZH68_015526 [Vespula germanica]